VGIFRIAPNAAGSGQRQVERRETASRPKNVSRLPKREKPVAARPKTVGGNDDWSEF
jgi:hypothetical protein